MIRNFICIMTEREKEIERRYKHKKELLNKIVVSVIVVLLGILLILNNFYGKIVN